MTSLPSRGRHARTTASTSRRKRAIRSLSALSALLFIVAVVVVTTSHGDSFASSTTSSTPSSSTTTSSVPLNQTNPGGKPAVMRRLALWRTLGGPISPKSVVATNTGIVMAQNMMYRHTVTVYNSQGVLLKSIPDAVRLSDFGVTGHPGYSRGAPVEAAVTPDGQYVWVSNYSMYGAGFGPEGSDTCSPASAHAAGDTNSYAYRISLKTLKIDSVVQVGIVPKYLAVTPNGKYLVVSNWCSWDAVVVDLSSNHVVARIPVGAYPRGIAISPDSTMAYVAIMGSTILAQINLNTMRVVHQIYVGSNVRHVVIDPINGQYLYVSLNASGVVEKINRATGHIMARVHTGSECRTLAISTDGTALFVVNYNSNTMTMLRSSDLHVLQNVATGTHPVGVTYDGRTGRVWVAVYTGALMIFDTK